MNKQAENLMELAIAVFKEEFELAKNKKRVQTTLKAINDACETIVKKGGAPIPPSVITWLATRRIDIKLATQTIYNTPAYKRIVNAWADVAAEMAVSKRGRFLPEAVAVGAFLTNKDLEEIRDAVVRHKVAIMLGQFNQLKNQAEMRKAIKDNPPIPRFLEAKEPSEAIAYDLSLNEDELEALLDFIKEASVKRRGIEFNDIGTVMAKRVVNEKPLSKPGFVEAIRKILESYNLCNIRPV